LRHVRRTVGAVGLVLAVALVAGCTGSDGVVEPSPSATASAIASSTASPSAAPDATATGAPQPTETAGIPAVEPSTTPAPTTGATVEVDVELTRYGLDGGRLTAGGVVYGVVETTGTCTLTVTGSSDERTVSGPASRSAETMACGEGLAVDVSGDAGPWTLVLAYESADYTGESEALEVSP